MPLKLRGDAAAFCVPTQMAIRHDATGGASGRSWRYVGTRPEGRVASSKYMINEEGMHVIRDKDARDSGQLLFFREKCCIFALSFEDRLN